MILLRSTEAVFGVPKLSIYLSVYLSFYLSIYLSNIEGYLCIHDLASAYRSCLRSTEADYLSDDDEYDDDDDDDDEDDGSFYRFYKKGQGNSMTAAISLRFQLGRKRIMLIVSSSHNL